MWMNHCVVCKFFCILFFGWCFVDLSTGSHVLALHTIVIEVLVQMEKKLLIKSVLFINYQCLCLIYLLSLFIVGSIFD